MKYYSAVVSKDEIESVCILPPFTILCSYHYFKSKIDIIKESLTKGYDVFIDSGAFSAANSGKEIDIDDYCRFIKETGVKTYAGLDVLGDAEATQKNQAYMIEKYDLNPIPTFHMGSKLKDLEPLLKYPYIALGGLVHSPGIESHCDEVWSYLLNNRPDIRVHGFGLTNLKLMERYPWYSVDSSSFKSCKRFGRQNVLWNGVKFQTFSEDEYKEVLIKQGYRMEDIENKELWKIYDLQSSQSYKIYAAHLKEINKHKNFNYLTNQQKLF